MKKLGLLFMAIMTAMIVKAQQIVPPTEAEAPRMEFAFQLYVTLEPEYTVGEVPHGKRVVIPITGGIFEGPKLKGTILPGGADYQYKKDSSSGSRTELEAIYSIKTDDGTIIHVRNTGIFYLSQDRKEVYFFASPKFEAPEDGPYAWLNNAVFVCAPAQSDPNTIRLNMWKVVR